MIRLSIIETKTAYRNVLIDHTSVRFSDSNNCAGAGDQFSSTAPAKTPSQHSLIEESLSARC